MFEASRLVSALVGTPDLSNQTHWYSSPEWWLCVLGFFTLLGILWQATATAKAALATEKIVAGSADTAKRELRAYLATAIGEALYQERRPGSPHGDLRFEASPIVLNTGKTPARKMKFKTRAAILPIPLPRETHLPEGVDDDVGENMLGPGQHANLSGTVDGFCLDTEVESIKSGLGSKGLYVWGRIDYEDVFGEAHFTRFCHHIYWDLSGKVRGHFVAGRNDAN